MSTTYPWLTFSAQTQARQREVNMRSILSGKCPPLVEDGKLGPSTCGAAQQFAGDSANIAEMVRSCRSVNASAADACNQLPWMRQSNETLTLQVTLNGALAPHGFCKITEDGVLGPKTCAAASKVMGPQANRIGCQIIGTLDVCAATEEPAAPITPPVVPEPVTAEDPTPVSPPPVVAAEPPPAPAPTPTPSGPLPPAPSVEEGSDWGIWAVAGGVVLAAGAGTWLLMRKKRRK